MRFDEVINKYGYPVVSKEVSDTVYGARHGGGTGKWKSTRLQKLKGEYKDKDGNISKYNHKKWEFLLDAPFEISEKCCNIMKKKPSKGYEKNTGRKPFVGTMASESRLRYQKWIQHGCNAFDIKEPKSQPLSFWTEQDVLKYIDTYKLPIPSVYGEITIDDKDIYYTTGCNRTGWLYSPYVS